MAGATDTRPPVISASLVTRLAELLAFRHVFRGTSIALIRWDKLSPLTERVSGVHDEVVNQLTQFQIFLRSDSMDTEPPR
jgi:hypothetical protein